MSSDSEYASSGNSYHSESIVGEDDDFVPQRKKRVKQTSLPKTAGKKSEQKLFFSLPHFDSIDWESSKVNYFAKLNAPDPSKEGKPKVEGDRANCKCVSLQRKKFIQEVLDHKIRIKTLEYELESKKNLVQNEKDDILNELETLRKATSPSFLSVTNSSQVKLTTEQFNAKWINQFAYTANCSKTLWKVSKLAEQRDEKYKFFWIRPQQELTQKVVCVEESFSYLSDKYVEFFKMYEGKKIVNKKKFADMIKDEEGTLTGDVAKMFLESLTEIIPDFPNSNIEENTMMGSSSSLTSVPPRKTVSTKKYTTNADMRGKEDVNSTTTSSSSRKDQQTYWSAWDGPNNSQEESFIMDSTSSNTVCSSSKKVYTKKITTTPKKKMKLRNVVTSRQGKSRNDKSNISSTSSSKKCDSPVVLVNDERKKLIQQKSKVGSRSIAAIVSENKNFRNYLNSLHIMERDLFFVYPYVGNAVNGGVGPSFIALLNITTDFVQLLPIEYIFDEDEVALVIASMLSFYTHPMSDFMLHYNGLPFNKDKYDSYDGSLSMFTESRNDNRYKMQRFDDTRNNDADDDSRSRSKNNWVS